METFDWRSKFMFCGRPCQKNIRNPNRNNCHKVATLHFKEKVLLSCQKRDDQISKEVALRARPRVMIWLPWKHVTIRLAE